MIVQTVGAAQAAALALIQGLTEFLPISSSAHLALLPMLTDWPDQGLAFDCVLHLGSLTAVLLYFRSELAAMTTGFARTLAARRIDADPDGRLAWYILLATIPVGAAGLAFKDVVEHDLRTIAVIATTSILFGLLLGWADLRGSRRLRDDDWSLRDALLVGAAQAVALIPGTSRSGITMTAALMLGYSREAAARFSFLLSIPVIVLAGGLKVKEWVQSTGPQPESAAILFFGYLLSALSAWLCIHYFLKYLNLIGMGPFVVYRILLGAALFLLLW
ncbi:MAG: undecaprenyl-diphosphate phosphatase [Zetaproteobacteria bacterium]|nr:MAG: undecaprenyl-diphosphate phosphatase [Zetaproteobacteria bacterium]